LEEVDEHDVGRHGGNSLGDGRTVVRFQADPFNGIAGNMQQTHLTYSCIASGGAAAHD